MPSFNMEILYFSSDSARSFLKKHQLGQYNEDQAAKKKAEIAARDEEEKAAANAISVGSRCKVEVPGQPTKLGTVMYVGKCRESLQVFLEF